MEHEVSQSEAWRSTVTAITESGKALSLLIDLWEEWFPDRSFLDEFFKPMWNDKNTSGVDQVSQLEGIANMLELPTGERATSDDRKVYLTIGFLMASCAF